MYIETERMIIRDFRQSDAAGLYAILGDEEAMANLEPAYDFEKTVKFLNTFCMDRKGAVAAVEKAGGALVGYILFSRQDEGVYEMGWIFNRDYWRQGYAYESCKAVIDYAFGEGNAHEIFAETIDTVKSVGLMRKLGMQPEGIQRGQAGEADLYLYHLLKEDWRKHENTDQ